MKQRIKGWLSLFFIDAMTGMAHGLFASLIIGTIMVQVGGFIPGIIGRGLVLIGSVASVLTGAGIGMGVAHRLKASTYVVVGTGLAGMIGAHAAKILSGGIVDGLSMQLQGPGEPLGAFIASFVAVEFGLLVSGKTPVDILVTPFVTITSGAIVGLAIGPGISQMMTALGAIINWGTERQPFLMGIIVSVLMGMILTLPISSAALGIVLGLSGLAAGAATVGCSAQMVGFAVASYRENKVSGLISQGIGTSMLQVPNIMRHPLIWVPPTLASAILGPIATMVFKMESNSAGSGMGTSGLVGQIMTWNVMGSTTSWPALLGMISLLHFIAPAALSLLFAEFMRKKGWIKVGDMLLEK
ncbi:PTS sugar transporter subunit IIC [Varibaculum cambriense]|uniref:PTS transporter subunit IIC n=1 Tax=Varibaculum cambriense TaxID=184870 RepID=UPI002901053A|nr:PTS sugar transporter subunit IIC [Varibaculum cambriense]MDU1223464.1 PTS sugar transporter subunit IIC [Varibaculum cambriense]